MFIRKKKLLKEIREMQMEIKGHIRVWKEGNAEDKEIYLKHLMGEYSSLCDLVYWINNKKRFRPFKTQ